MSQLRGTNLVVDTVQAKRSVISGSGATRTLNENESGSTVLFDRAAGIIFTLPVAKPGTFFDFAVTTTITSNSAKIITGAATEFLIGGLTSVDTDTSNAVAFFSGNGSTHIAVTMNGSTTGAVLGTKFRATCLSTTRWMIEGQTFGTGVVATPFSTS
jgi:hypothetical protein